TGVATRLPRGVPSHRRLVGHHANGGAARHQAPPKGVGDRPDRAAGDSSRRAYPPGPSALWAALYPGTARPTAAATADPSGTSGPADPRSAANLAALRVYAERQYVNALISKMSLDEEIGQMIQVSFYNDKQMTPALAYEISHYHIGSVIMYANNVQ